MAKDMKIKDKWAEAKLNKLRQQSYLWENPPQPVPQPAWGEPDVSQATHSRYKETINKIKDKAKKTAHNPKPESERPRWKDDYYHNFTFKKNRK